MAETVISGEQTPPAIAKKVSFPGNKPELKKPPASSVVEFKNNNTPNQELNKRIIHLYHSKYMFSRQSLLVFVGHLCSLSASFHFQPNSSSVFLIWSSVGF
jgi:hypothetical protein